MYSDVSAASMAQTPDDLSPHIELIPATREQEPVLANLLELYAHDFSEFHDVEIGPDGRFGYASLPLYWTDPARHPFLAMVDGRLAGFVLVKQGSEMTGNTAAWDIAEFFVLRAYRRRGIGTRLAHQVWSRFPGPWEVRIMPSNAAAHHFWARAVAKFTGSAVHPVLIEKGDQAWRLFSFESKRANRT
jgi:predicted acetyltransferase